MAGLNLRDELYWLAATVLQEAGGEPPLGQLAVAWVVLTRARAANHSVCETVLAPLQFSCWNGNSPTRKMLAEVDDRAGWLEAWDEATAAYFAHRTDPTGGATHYCRSDLDPLPSWFDPTRVTVVIGHHSFLKLP